MKQHTKRLIVLVLAQTACLALGLWLEQRFAHSVRQTDAGAAALSGERQAVNNDVSQQPVWIVHAMAFVWIAALQAVVAYLVLSRAQEATRRHQHRAERASIERHNELLRTRDAVIFGLAKLAESRDGDTGQHLERIALYSTRLAAALRRNSQYRRQITPQFLRLIGISASLHDIGKVGIADSVLLKPGKFEMHERHAMNLHAAIGGKCIRDIETRLGKSNFLQMAREIAYSHHECWDGSGYPRGLSGDEIPLAARIVAVADVYDALASKRVYKEALLHEQCVALIEAERGKQFDPAVVAAFLEIEHEFRDISQRYTESGELHSLTPFSQLERETEYAS